MREGPSGSLEKLNVIRSGYRRVSDLEFPARGRDAPCPTEKRSEFPDSIHAGNREASERNTTEEA